jgi:hypothetical protein
MAGGANKSSVPLLKDKPTNFSVQKEQTNKQTNKQTEHAPV